MKNRFPPSPEFILCWRPSHGQNELFQVVQSDIRKGKWIIDTSGQQFVRYCDVCEAGSHVDLRFEWLNSLSSAKISSSALCGPATATS